MSGIYCDQCELTFNGEVRCPDCINRQLNRLRDENTRLNRELMIERDLHVSVRLELVTLQSEIRIAKLKAEKTNV